MGQPEFNSSFHLLLFVAVGPVSSNEDISINQDEEDSLDDLFCSSAAAPSNSPCMYGKGNSDSKADLDISFQVVYVCLVCFCKPHL